MTTPRDDTSERLNLLIAYPYLDDACIRVVTENRDRIRFLLDSGAFTAFRLGRPVALDDYCRFIERLPFRPWRYFALDVIGDPKGTLANYETMLKRGFNPVPVFTRGEHPSVLEEYYRTSDLVGIGGLVRTTGKRGFLNGVMKIAAGRNTHWLGYHPEHYLKFYRPYSVDSSTWASALIYGTIKLFDAQGKVHPVMRRHFMQKPEPHIEALVRECAVEPAELAIAGNWKNSGKGDYPTEKVAFRTFVQFQRRVGRNLGTLLFMAVSGGAWQPRLALDAFDFWQQRTVKGLAA